jgi:hypothetical protein
MLVTIHWAMHEAEVACFIGSYGGEDPRAVAKQHSGIRDRAIFHI